MENSVELETILRTIEIKLKDVPFEQGKCEIKLDMRLDNPYEVITALMYKGYRAVVILRNTLLLSWDVCKDCDGYYISNSSVGNVFVAKGFRESEFKPYEIKTMKYYGNYFKSREEAQKLAEQLNKMLPSNFDIDIFNKDEV